MAGENFSTEEISHLNDLRRRIANGQEYSEEEVVVAIQLFAAKRAEALKMGAPSAKKSTGRKVTKTIDLDDLDNL